MFCYATISVVLSFLHAPANFRAHVDVILFLRLASNLWMFAGKSVLITIGGLVAGAVAGSAVESWLQVEIVPFLGLHSPAAVITEFILFSQFLVTLYLI